MDTNMFTSAGLCPVIVVLLAFIVKMIWNLIKNRDDLVGVL